MCTVSNNAANCEKNFKENLAYLWQTAYNVLLKRPNQHTYHLGAPRPFPQVMLVTLAFGRLLGDVFNPSVLFYSIIPCRLKALPTNQKDGAVSTFFFFCPLSPCEHGSCVLFGEPAELCHSGREGAACQRRDQAGAFLACEQSLSQM